MKMRLVPSEATEEMRDAAQEAVHYEISENGATRAVNAAIAAAPHAGKVSAEQFREAVYASCSAVTAFGCGCFSVKYPPCKGTIKQVRAVLEAIGLEVEG